MHACIKLFFPCIYIPAVPDVFVSHQFTNYAVGGPQIAIDTVRESNDQALTCHTDRAECCRDQDVSGPNSAIGDWTFPDGRTLPNASHVIGQSDVFYFTRDRKAVRLHRRGSITTPNGTFCCRVLNFAGNTVQFCVDLGELLS